jgi:tRNA uridine 5-carbamoylmethylation protein Kti12
MKLIIIRGPSGSGKSTLARHLGGRRGVNWFEADMFFEQNGSYQFDPRKLGQAHVWCQAKTMEALYERPETVVIVSNTSTTLSEANTYLNIADKLGADCEVIRTAGPWNIDDLFSRNEHNVPRAVLEKQVARYVPVNGEREWSDLSIFNGVK